MYVVSTGGAVPILSQYAKTDLSARVAKEGVKIGNPMNIACMSIFTGNRQSRSGEGVDMTIVTEQERRCILEILEHADAQTWFIGEYGKTAYTELLSVFRDAPKAKSITVEL